MKPFVQPLVMLVCLGQVAGARELGAVFEDPAAYQSIPLAMPPARGELPARVDISDRFPSPGDQGEQGSCVGWAVGYALKGYQEKVERRWSGTSPAENFSPSYIYNQIKLDKGGARISDAFDFLIRAGAATLEQFPYDATNDSRQPPAATCRAAREFAIAAWRRVDTSQAADTKSHLASGFPVVIGMWVSPSFIAHRSAAVFTHQEGEEDKGAHAMCVVGYDDGRRAFKVMNSWGRGWGDGGFGWVSYNTFKTKTREAYVAQDIVVNRPDDAGGNDGGGGPAPSPVVVIEPEATPETPWVFPDSDRRQLAPGELRVCSAYQLWRARNEIYARHGFRFSTARGMAYARSLGAHYTPRTADSDEVERGFNPIENHNVALITAFEQGRPNPVGPLPSSPWVFPDSAARRLTPGEVGALSPERRWRARNEIFARNGYMFQTDRGKALARSIGRLYHPVSADMDRIYAALNPIERYNIELIQRFEK